MARCGYCGTSILFGGLRDGNAHYCNAECHQRGVWLAVGSQLPADLVERYVEDARIAPCPRCQGCGPVDIHLSYRVWSVIVFTRWATRTQVCCASCGWRAKFLDLCISLLFGWWGFPWGLVVTPIQVGRNLIGLFSMPDSTRPSEQFRNVIKIQLAQEALRASTAAPESGR